MCPCLLDHGVTYKTLFLKEDIHETSHGHNPKHIKYTKEIWQNTNEIVKNKYLEFLSC